VADELGRVVSPQPASTNTRSKTKTATASRCNSVVAFTPEGSISLTRPAASVPCAWVPYASVSLLRDAGNDSSLNGRTSRGERWPQRKSRLRFWGIGTM
jgi:hypothetical protein